MMLKRTGLVIGLILLTGLIGTVQAQRGAERFILQYGDQLELTDSQKQQILALRLEQRGEMMQQRRDNRNRAARQGRMDRMDRPQMRMQMQHSMMENRMELRSELLEILNEDQQARLKETLVEEVDERAELMRLQHEQMVENAGIEGEKAQQVLRIMNTQHSVMADHQKERIMSGEPFSREEMQAHQERMQQTREQIKNLLTAAEYEKLQEQMRLRRPQNPMGRPMNRRNNR
ncbi:MAG: Spy/CpxP family protein refolding chaperone [Balneolaceae bacterium]|nr:Spy/CpxP family protein refolding chaperone [Balneolaceae bacterium]